MRKEVFIPHPALQHAPSLLRQGNRPPDVLKGLEAQTPVACKNPRGTITYARADVRYAMDFEAMET